MMVFNSTETVFLGDVERGTEVTTTTKTPSILKTRLSILGQAHT